MIRLFNVRWPYGPDDSTALGKYFLSHINNSFCRGKFPNCLKYIYIYTYILYIWRGSIIRNYGVLIIELLNWMSELLEIVDIYIYIGTDFFARHHRWLAMADGWWLTIDGCDLYINTYHRYLAMADGWWVNFYGFEIQPRYICLMGPCFDRYVNAQFLY